MLPQYIKKKDDVVYFDGDGELIYYIPENFFSTKNAVIIGETVSLMGLFNYNVFHKDGKQTGLRLFNYPSIFECRPTEITKEAELLLKGTHTPMAYRLLHFKKGSQLICSNKIPKKVQYAEKFFDILLRGKIPENTPYDTIHELIPYNANINGFSYPLNNQVYGILVSELYRDPKNLKQPFRVSKSTDMTNYKAVSITQVPKYISPYTSITSENADESIANAMTNNSYKESPLEKVMMN